MFYTITFLNRTGVWHHREYNGTIFIGLWYSTLQFYFALNLSENTCSNLQMYCFSGLKIFIHVSTLSRVVRHASLWNGNSEIPVCIYSRYGLKFGWIPPVIPFSWKFVQLCVETMKRNSRFHKWSISLGFNCNVFYASGFNVVNSQNLPAPNTISQKKNLYQVFINLLCDNAMLLLKPPVVDNPLRAWLMWFSRLVKFKVPLQEIRNSWIGFTWLTSKKLTISHIT